MRTRMNRMFLSAITAFLGSVAIVASVMACDMDGDGKDDVLAYQRAPDHSFTWRWRRSSDGVYQNLTHDASKKSYPAPGYYLGNGHPAAVGHIEADNVLWRVYNSLGLDQVIGFALPDLSYYPGLDINGDGVSDMLKIFDRCDEATKACYAQKPHGLFVFNNSDGSTTFQNLTTATRFFGRGNSPLVALDINGDGSDDMCAGIPFKGNPTKFKFTCTDVQTEATVKAMTVGKLYNPPFALKRTGKAAFFVTWQKVGSQITFSWKDDTNAAKTAKVKASGRMVTGDYLGLGYQQVLFKGNGTNGAIFDLITGQKTTLTDLPSGTVKSCTNNLVGAAEKSPLTSVTSKGVF